MPTVRPRAVLTACAIIEDLSACQVELGRTAFYFSIGQPLEKKALNAIASLYPDLKKVTYVDERDRKRLVDEIKRDLAVEGDCIEACLARPGYASARNSATLEALRDSNDIAIYVDDDALPILPIGSQDRIRWQQALFMGAHLDKISEGAAVSIGHHLGYTSPIVDLRSVLAEPCLSELGLALSIGSEVLTADSLIFPAPVSLRLPALDQFRAYIGSRAGYFVSGGNLGVSIEALAQGSVPPFYCPDSARGEDAFFSALLDGRRVKIAEVDSVLFHDPFAIIDGLSNEQLPQSLPAYILPTPTSISRFTAAMLGWLRYSPLWITHQTIDSNVCAQKIEEIRTLLKRHSNCCLQYLNIAHAGLIFEEACANVSRDFDTMTSLDELWRSTIAPSFHGKRCR